MYILSGCSESANFRFGSVAGLQYIPKAVVRAAGSGGIAACRIAISVSLRALLITKKHLQDFCTCHFCRSGPRAATCPRGAKRQRRSSDRYLRISRRAAPPARSKLPPRSRLRNGRSARIRRTFRFDRRDQLRCPIKIEVIGDPDFRPGFDERHLAED